MKTRSLFVGLALLLAVLIVALGARTSYTFPSLTDHPHDSDVIEWEKDGSKDGSDPHNHYSATYFGGLGIFTHPYTVTYCWDNTTYRIDRAGTFDNGHCFVDESDNSNIPAYYFVGAGWPAAAKSRVREAFAAWAAVTSAKPELVTGLAFREAGSEAGADIKLYWENIDDSSGGGYWLNSDRTLHMDSSYNWYFPTNPSEGQPGGIQNNEWHFFSVVLHEVGHGVGFNHQTDNDDVMTPVVGQPPNVAGHRYFTALDADSMQGVRDLYSQPRQRIAFVIDDTGSMGDEIDLVKTTVSDKVDEFVADGLDLDYHLLTYKDAANYVGRTSDPNTIKAWVNALVATGGGDCPEEMLGALNRIADEAPYSDAWVMTDAGFHGGPGDLAATIANLVLKHVTVHPIIYSWCFSGPEGSDAGQARSATMEGVEGGDVGPESFAQIAQATGGHYFRIFSGETQDAASILLNEMVTNGELSRYVGSVSFGSPMTYSVQVETGLEEVNFLLNDPSFVVDMAVYDPSGDQVVTTDPDVAYFELFSAEYYQIASPAAGVWTAVISTGSSFGEFIFSSSADSDVILNLLSSTTLTRDEINPISLSLTGDVTSVAFKIVSLEGADVADLELYDDGAHSDGTPGDGIYAGEYVPDESGSFRLRVTGALGDGSMFERVAGEVLQVHTLDVSSDSGLATILPGDTYSYTFTVSNGAAISDTFDLTLSSTLGWAGGGSVPATIQLEAGESIEFAVPVTAPDGTPSGTSDITSLSAVSQGNPLVNDVAFATTTALVAADMSLEATDNPDPVTTEPIKYTLEISNIGPLAATNIVLSATVALGDDEGGVIDYHFGDRLENGELEIIDFTAEQGTCTVATTVLSCELGNLESGDSILVTVSVSHPEELVAVTLTAAATADQDDPDESNNTVAESTQVAFYDFFLPMMLRE